MSDTSSRQRRTQSLDKLGVLAQAPQELDERCVIKSELEIAFVLRSLKQQNALVALYFDGGARHLITSVLGMDPKRRRVFLEPSADSGLNELAVGAHPLTFVSALSDVKVQFECAGVERARFEDDDALAIALPGTLLRMQRREYFRMPTPVTNPPRCIIPFQDASGARQAEVPILDISAGGVGLADQHYAFHFETGTILEGCRIALPELGELLVNLHVMNAFTVRLDGGLTCVRAGCEFVDMPEYKTSIVQRYVLDLERARNARRGLLR